MISVDKSHSNIYIKKHQYQKGIYAALSIHLKHFSLSLLLLFPTMQHEGRLKARIKLKLFT